MKATILLIDHYHGSRDSLGHTLRSEGYDVTVAFTGQEALNSLRQTGFDLVLLDLDVGTGSLWPALGQIITISLSLPLIIIAGHPDQRHLAAQQGVTAILEKPLDLPLLLRVVDRALAGASDAHGNGARPESPDRP